MRENEMVILQAELYPVLHKTVQDLVVIFMIVDLSIIIRSSYCIFFKCFIKNII